jgi:integrase/recombinase XerD
MTKAASDHELVDTWLAGMRSPHTRRNFETTARSFVAALAAIEPAGLRKATVEDVRAALEAVTAGKKPSSAAQAASRVKSLISYGHRLGYLRFNVGAAIRVSNPSDPSKRTVSEVEVRAVLMAAAPGRDRTLLTLLYAGGLRLSEALTLTWNDVRPQDTGVQLHVLGKGNKVRKVLLPPSAGSQLLTLRQGAPEEARVFQGDPAKQRSGEGSLSRQAAWAMLKAAAAKAGVTCKVSPHWLRHCHATHSLQRGAPVADVQQTLGHGNVATTSRYLGSDPDRSSGFKLDPAVWGGAK